MLIQRFALENGRGNIRKVENFCKVFFFFFVNMRELPVKHTKSQQVFKDLAKQRLKGLLPVHPLRVFEGREELFILKNNSWYKAA